MRVIRAIAIANSTSRLAPKGKASLARFSGVSTANRSRDLGPAMPITAWPEVTSVTVQRS